MLRRSVVAFVVPAALSTGPSFAHFVNPGEATDSHQVNDLGGTILDRKVTQFAWQGNEEYFGRIISGVAQNPQTNTLCFFYQFVNYSNWQFNIDSLQVGSFTGYQTEIRTLDAENGLPDSARSADGSTIEFGFDQTSGVIDPNAKSLTVIVHTDATEYNDDGTATVEGNVIVDEEAGYGIASIAAFAPTAAALPAETPVVPEDPNLGEAPGTPVVAPLPAPVWTGFAGIAGSILYVLRLKRRA